MLDLKTNELYYFDRNTHIAKQIVLILNTSLESEWSAFYENTEEKKKFTKINLQVVDNFNLPIYSDDEKFRWDSGLASIIHSWTRTTPDIFGSDRSFDVNSHTCLNTFDLMDNRMVERFRQIVLLWFIGNSMNMHIFMDLREKVIVPTEA